MEGRNPRKGCAALVLGHYHQRRAGVARIRQTWLPPGRIRQPDEASQPASRVPGSGSAGGLLRNPPEGAFTPARTCPGRLRRPFVIAGPRSAALAGVGVTSETAAGPRRLWAITPKTTFLCGRWRQRPQPGEAADQSDTAHSLTRRRPRSAAAGLSHSLRHPLCSAMSHWARRSATYPAFGTLAELQVHRHGVALHRGAVRHCGAHSPSLLSAHLAMVAPCFALCGSPN
jgi:hypothetical protein